MRISRDMAGENQGVIRQEEDCRAVAEHYGWNVAEVYVDNDISATSKKPRPAYRKMLRDIESGLIDAIVCWHPDRLYRKAVDLAELVEVVQRQRVPVQTARAGDVDFNSPTGLLVAEMLSAIAMYEVRHKSERWQRSWQQKRELGEVPRTGSRMFGYDRAGEIVEDEAELTREMVRRLLVGESLHGVARWLEGLGVTATRGSTWTPPNIKRYLLNPRLAGYSTLKGEIVGEGDWVPIVDRADYETLRAMLQSRARDYIPRVSLLNGLIFCGECGHRLITGHAQTKGGGKRTYRCPNRPGLRGCGKTSAMSAPIDEMVTAYAQRRLDDNRVRENLARKAGSPTETLNELSALDGRIRELEHQLEEPDVPVETLVRAITRAKARRSELEAKLIDERPATLPARGGKWPDDLIRQRALIELVVEKVVLNRADVKGARVFQPDRITITAR